MPQSRIQDHFEPSNKYPSSSKSQQPAARRWSTDSEGSEGLDAILLSDKKTRAGRKESGTQAQMSQRRASKRVVVVSDDEEEEEEDEEEEEEGEEAEYAAPVRSSRRRKSDSPPARKAGRSGRKAADSDEAVPSEPDSLDGLLKSRRRVRKRHSSPERESTPTPTSRPERNSSRTQRTSSADFVIQVPSLSTKDRAKYSLFDSPATHSPSKVTKPSSRITRSTPSQPLSPSPRITRSARPLPGRKEVIVLSSDNDDESSSDDDHTPITSRRRVPSRSKSYSSPINTKRPSRATVSPLIPKRPPPGKVKPKPSPTQSKRVQKRILSPESESEPEPAKPRRVPRSAKRSKRDPDESGDDSPTEGEDLVAELELDESDRFKIETRLRPSRETDFQRSMRKMKNKKNGVIEIDTEDEDEDDWHDHEEGGPRVQADGDEESEDADFISDDGGEVPDDLLPHEFSLNSLQTPEYKFKVVFHYLLYLVMKGPKVLPLRGEPAAYFEPHLRDVRLRMQGYRESSVRSQIWKPAAVKLLRKYPNFSTSPTDGVIRWCDACDRRTPSRLYVWLGGVPYNHDTHEEVEYSSSSASEGDKKGKKSAKKAPTARRRKPDIQLTMGPHCAQRSQIFHQLAHWEDDMYDRVQAKYQDLLRAAGERVAGDSDDSSEDDSDEDEDDRLERRTSRADRRARDKTRAEELRKEGKLPEDVNDVDEVLLWMDKNRYQASLFSQMEALERSVRGLEIYKGKKRGHTYDAYTIHTAKS